MAAQKLKKITHLIIDLDGTILDTETIYKQVISSIAERFDKKYTPELMGRVVGNEEWEYCKKAVVGMDIPMTVDQFHFEWRALSVHHFRNGKVGLLPGVKEVVEHFYANNIPMAIATTSARRTFDYKAGKNYPWFKKHFSHVVFGGSDIAVQKNKPEPDIFLVCASRFKDKPAPENCLVIEDSPNGIQAAKKAGMPSALVPDKLLPQDQRTDATVVAESIDQIPFESFGLPPFPGGKRMAKEGGASSKEAEGNSSSKQTKCGEKIKEKTKEEECE